MKNTYFHISILFAALLFTAACGSSGSSGSSGSGSTLSAGVTEGVITGFGSVILNGRTLSTGGATISVNDSSTDIDSLRKGMKVRARGELSNDGTSGTSPGTRMEVRRT